MSLNLCTLRCKYLLVWSRINRQTCFHSTNLSLGCLITFVIKCMLSISNFKPCTYWKFHEWLPLAVMKGTEVKKACFSECECVHVHACVCLRTILKYIFYLLTRGLGLLYRALWLWEIASNIQLNSFYLWEMGILTLWMLANFTKFNHFMSFLKLNWLIPCVAIVTSLIKCFSRYYSQFGNFKWH